MEDLLNYSVQNGFAIAVAIYLLYERSKFNTHIAECLTDACKSLERIEERINEKTAQNVV